MKDDTMNDETNANANVEANANEVETNNSTETATAEPTETKAQRKARRKAAAEAKAAAAAKAAAKAKRKSAAEHFGTIKPTQHDTWGCRIGSKSAVIDAVLMKAKVPLTIKEIHEACKGKGRETEGATRQHVISRLKRGQVKLRDGAYIAVKKNESRKPTETSESAE